MLMNLAIGLVLMVACLLLQALWIVAAARRFRRRTRSQVTRSFWSGVHGLASMMLLLIVGNLAQIGLWALLFLQLGEFQLYSEAFYHSAVNFSTLGYGDVVMSARHKLLGPLEAVNGALMIGMSTATLATAFQIALQDEPRRPG